MQMAELNIVANDRLARLIARPLPQEIREELKIVSPSLSRLLGDARPAEAARFDISFDRLAAVCPLEAQDTVNTGHVPDASLVARLHRRVQHRALGEVSAELGFGAGICTGELDEARLFGVRVAGHFEGVPCF